MKTIKANLYSLISIIIEIFSILFLFFPIVEVVEQENIYIYHFKDYTGIAILKGEILSLPHQIFLILFIILTCSLIFIHLCSILFKKSYFKVKKILFFLQLAFSFSLLSHYNFIGFILEILLFIPFVFMIVQETHLKKENNGNMLFYNVLWGVILMFMLILILSLDAFVFANILLF